MIPISSNEVLKIRTAKLFRCFPAFVSNGSFFQRSDRGRHRIGRPRTSDDLKVAVVGCMVPMVQKPFGDVKGAHPYELSIAQPSLQTFELLSVLQTVARRLCLSNCLGSKNVTPEAWEIKYPVFWAVKSTMWGPRWITKLVNETITVGFMIYPTTPYIYIYPTT